MPIKLTDEVTKEKSSSVDEETDTVNGVVNSAMSGRRMRNLRDGLPLENMQPSICMNYIICCLGIYPDYLEVPSEES